MSFIIPEITQTLTLRAVGTIMPLKRNQFITSIRRIALRVFSLQVGTLRSLAIGRVIFKDSEAHHAGRVSHKDRKPGKQLHGASTTVTGKSVRAHSVAAGERLEA